MKVSILRDRCIGCSLCVSICPEIFQLDDQGIAIIINLEGCDGCNCREVAEVCPVEAIKVED